jgi:raffinose/stachyose/melibiose transport system substrate-binding protein
MDTAASQTKGTIDASSPQFRYSHHPLPGGANANLTKTVFIPNDTLGVNSHSSAAAQQAAQDFVDFIARPKQNALIAQIQGGVTQQQLVKGPIPAYMSAFSSVLRQHRYVITPLQTWWNASVLLALQQNQIGVITGQRSIDDVLEAMDAAWKLGGD